MFGGIDLLIYDVTGFAKREGSFCYDSESTTAVGRSISRSARYRFLSKIACFWKCWADSTPAAGGIITTKEGQFAENKEGERFATWVGAPDESGLWSC